MPHVYGVKIILVGIIWLFSVLSFSVAGQSDCGWHICVTLQNVTDLTYRKNMSGNWSEWKFPEATANVYIYNQRILVANHYTAGLTKKQCNGGNYCSWSETYCVPFNQTGKVVIGLRIFDTTNSSYFWKYQLANEGIQDINLLLSTDPGGVKRTDLFAVIQNSTAYQFKKKGKFYYSVYLTTESCVEIINGNFAFSRQYSVQGLVEMSHGTVSSSSLARTSTAPRFDAKICGERAAKKMSIQFVDVDSQTQLTLPISTKTSGYQGITVQNYGKLNVSIFSGNCGTDKFLQEVKLITTVSYSYLTSLCCIGFLVACSAVYASVNRYRSSDPVNYFAMLWVVLDSWDFFSDISFCWLLSARKKTLPMFFVSLIILLSSYSGKMFYMVHLLQVWNNPGAPRQTRHWLEKWSWFLISMSMFLGGVHPALELCNSVLFPIEVFGMHLPFAEMVHVRTQRFTANVITENLPALVLQLVYFLRIAPNSQSQFIFFATVISSCLSFLFSAAYYFAHRGSYSNTSVYQFSFRIEGFELREYMVHSQWKIQTAIQEVFHLNTATSVVIDQCTASRGENDIVTLRVEGRVLSEVVTKKGNSNSELTTTNMRFSVINSLLTGEKENNTKNEQMSQLLLTALRHQLNLGKNPEMQSWKISSINPPELLYDRSTEVFRCCARITKHTAFCCIFSAQWCFAKCFKRQSTKQTTDGNTEDREEGHPNTTKYSGFSRSTDGELSSVLAIKPPNTVPVSPPKTAVIVGSTQQTALPDISLSVGAIANNDQTSKRPPPPPVPKFKKQKTLSDGERQLTAQVLAAALNKTDEKKPSRGLPALDLAQVKPAPEKRKSLVNRTPPVAVNKAAIFEQLNKTNSKRKDAEKVSSLTDENEKQHFEYKKSNNTIPVEDHLKKQHGLSVNQLFPTG